WWMRCYFSESRRFIEDALTAAPADTPEALLARARANATASFASYHEHDEDAVCRHADEAAALDAALGHPDELALLAGWAIIDRAEIARRRDDRGGASDLLAAARARVTGVAGAEYAIA